MDVRKGDAIKDGTTIIGYKTKVKIVKNKLAAPFQTAEFDIIFGQGINKEGTLLDMAIEADIIQKSGAWISYKGDKIGQGRENARLYLINHPEVCEEILVLVKEKLFTRNPD